MGKAKPRHKKNRKHNKSQPTGIETVKSVLEEESELQIENNEEGSIQNIIEEIQSSNVEEIKCGLQSMMSVTENPSSVQSVLKLNALKIMAPLLIHKNPEVRNLTAGILRNMSSNGSVEICERLVKDDIMTPLLALLHQYNDWKPDATKTEDTDTLLQVINILWNLCELDETALKYFNSANLLSILLRCLDYKTVGIDLSIVVCQCLNSVSEDNAAVTSALRNHESELLSMLVIDAADNKLILLKTLVAGLVMNLSPVSPWLASVLSVTQEALVRGLRAEVGQLTSLLPLDAATVLSPDTQTLLDNTEALADAQIMALEILANLTASQDEEMEMESEESASEDEDAVNGWCESEDTSLSTASPEIIEGLDKYKLVTTVIGKLDSLPENVIEIIKTCPNSKSLFKRIERLQCRAFLCFNNLVAMMDLEQLGGAPYLYSLVKQISIQSLLPNLANNNSIELVEATTTAVRAILLRLASIKFSDLGQIAASDLEMMFNIGTCTDPRVQANAIRIVGTLGILLVNHDPHLVKMAGNYLMESAEKQQTLWLAAEALDSLMDMFAEDSTDQAAADINLVPRLQSLAPRLKSRVRQERKRLGDHYPVISTAMTNLLPFIKYKGARTLAPSK